MDYAALKALALSYDTSNHILIRNAINATQTGTKVIDLSPGAFSSWLTSSGVRFILLVAQRTAPAQLADVIGVAFDLEHNPHVTSIALSDATPLVQTLVSAGVVSQAVADAFFALFTVPTYWRVSVDDIATALSWGT